MLFTRIKDWTGAPYFSEDKLLFFADRFSSLCAQLDGQVGADAIARNASSGYPGVVAELASLGVFKKLQEHTKQLGLFFNPQI